MHTETQDISTLPILELQQLWSRLWDKPIQPRISRQMLEQSILYKQRELRGEGYTPDQQAQLAKLIKQYKRDPKSFGYKNGLKPGTRLVRVWQGKAASVMVKDNGFEYDGKLYFSLSEIAFTITGTRWNGWTFFKVKQPRKVLPGQGGKQ